MLWIAVNGEWLDGTGATEAVTVILKAECEVFASGASLPMLTWI